MVGTIDDPNRPSDSYLFSLRYLFLVNLMTCGVELCSSAAFGYLPPLLLEAGVSEANMSIIISIGPMIAFFLLPLMGTMSDNCTSQYGRRRPFLLTAGTVCFISMVMLAFQVQSDSLITYIVTQKRANFILLSIAIVAFDLSTQLCFTPLESLLSDPCRSDHHHNKSFAVFTFLLSIGACIGYLLLSIDWSKTVLSSIVGGQRECIFVVLCAIFTISSGITLMVAYDPPLRSQPSFSDTHLNNIKYTNALNSNFSPPISNGTVHHSSTHPTSFIPSHSTVVPTPILPKAVIFRRIVNLPVTYFKCLCPQKIKVLFEWIASTTSDTILSLRTMPRALRKLWLANLLSNTAVLGFRLYFTDYVGEALYKGNPEAEEGSMERGLYDLGKY